MFKTIVVGTDGSSTSQVAVDRAAELAKMCGGSIHLVTAFKSPSQAMASVPEGAGMVPMPTDEEVRKHVESHLESAADRLRQSGVQVTTYACPGSAAHAVLEVADHQGADLIVVGSRGMTGARRVLGSVPNNVAHHAPCSVLIVQTC
jgi:nucleotide-binding universal stress UspA family protein